MKWTGMWLTVLASFLLTGTIFALEPSGVLKTTMADRVHAVLLEALESHTFPEWKKEEWLARNREALEHLRSVPLPDFDQLERVHVYSAKEPEQFFNAWRVRGASEEPAVIMPDLTERTVSSDAVSKIEVFDYADELGELIDYLQHRDPGSKRPWDFTFICDFGSGGLPYYGGVFLLYHAYAAAWLGQKEQAKALVHQALSQKGLSFEHAYNEKAWQSFRRGIRILEGGSDRKDVLTHWEKTLELYASSRYGEQLQDLVTQLRIQVEEDERLRETDVEHPENLPLDDRIDYYVARLPDVHGVQVAQPGHCVTVGMWKGTDLSDALVEIGRPAVPTLIEHLTDRRTTRSIGFWRNFAPSRTVLRVQDVCVQCIEAILDIRFYGPSSTSSYLSNEESEVRQEVITDIRSWWEEYGQKSPLEGQIGRLETGSIGGRIQTLEKIEKIDKQAVDSIALLKRWAITCERDRLPDVAEALAKRGDFFFLPRIREMLRGQPDGVPHGVVWYLMRYGDADDYRHLLNVCRKELEGGRKWSSSHFVVAIEAGLSNTDNTLAVPILVHLLDQREVSGSRWISQEKGSMGFSCADSCMEDLIRLTGHDEGYDRGAPEEERCAAIERWLKWWEREGRNEYIGKYPDVRKVLGDDGKPRSQERFVRYDFRVGDPVRVVTKDGHTISLESGTVLTGDVEIVPWKGPFGLQEYEHPSYYKVRLRFLHEGRQWKYEGMLTKWDLWPDQNGVVSRTPPETDHFFDSIADLADSREDWTLRFEDRGEYTFRVKYIACEFRILLSGGQIFVYCRHYDPTIADYREIFYPKEFSDIFFLKATKLYCDAAGNLQDFAFHEEDYVDLEPEADAGGSR